MVDRHDREASGDLAAPGRRLCPEQVAAPDAPGAKIPKTCVDCGPLAHAAR